MDQTPNISLENRVQPMDDEAPQVVREEQKSTNFKFLKGFLAGTAVGLIASTGYAVVRASEIAAATYTQADLVRDVVGSGLGTAVLALACGYVVTPRNGAKHTGEVNRGNSYNPNRTHHSL